MPDHLHVPSALVAAVLTAAVVNVAQFPTIEGDVSDWYEAVRAKPGHDLGALVGGHFDSTRQQIGLEVQLRALAPGATLVVPSATSTFVWRTAELRGLGGLEAVVRRGDPIVIDAAVATALDPAVVAVGEKEDVGPYAIALPADGRVERLVLVDGPDRAWVVEEGLLDAARAAAGR